MSTQFTNRQWRLPNNENKDKQSNYSMDKFDQNDYISTPLTIDEFSSATMSIWFKTSLSQSDKYFLTFPEASGANGFDLNFVTSGIKSYLQGHSGSNNITSTFTYNDGNWHHVIVSYSGTNHKMYIDGVLTSLSSATVGTIKNAEGNLYIGALSSLYPAYRVSQTKLDQVVVFNYALSDGGVSVGQTATGQIATLYGGGSAIGNPQSITPNPVAWYNLGDQDSFNGADYLVPNSSLKDYVFSFDGSNDYIEVGTGLGNTLGSSVSDMTVSLWYKNQTGSNEGLFTIMSSITAGTTNPFAISYNTNSIYVWFGSNYNYYSQTLDSNWHHLSIVKNGTSLTTYIDGSSVSPSGTVGSIPATIDTTNKKTFIGVYYNASFTYNGSISNVQVFNTALPATGSNSVETLYNNGSPLTSMSGFTSLQGWWKLDASATYDSSTTTWNIPDSSSNSNTGTSSGMTQANLVQSDLSFTSGYSPYALSFDSASSDYIDCGNDSSLNVSTSNYSLSFWIKTTSTTNLVVCEKGSNDELAIQTYTSGNIRWAGINSFETSGVNVSDGNWHHLVFVADSSSAFIYIDKNLNATGGNKIKSSSNTDSFYIGSRAGLYGFNGSISNVSIWNTALTSTQVTELYNEGVPSNLNNHSAYSNLVSWWQLGSNSSFNTNWTVLDEKGSNNGTSVNMIESDIVDGVGSYANGLSSGMGGDEVIGDAPYSNSNSLSVNMDVLDRTTDTPS